MDFTGETEHDRPVNVFIGAKSSEKFSLIKLAGNNRVQQFKYLGHIVTAGIKDDLDIARKRAKSIGGSMQHACP